LKATDLQFRFTAKTCVCLVPEIHSADNLHNIVNLTRNQQIAFLAINLKLKENREKSKALENKF